DWDSYGFAPLLRPLRAASPEPGRNRMPVVSPQVRHRRVQVQVRRDPANRSRTGSSGGLGTGGDLLLAPVGPAPSAGRIVCQLSKEWFSTNDWAGRTRIFDLRRGPVGIAAYEVLSSDGADAPAAAVASTAAGLVPQLDCLHGRQAQD